MLPGRSMFTLALCLLLGTATVLAAHPRVDRARRAWDELRYDDVLGEVAAARREGGLDTADEAELARLEAFVYAVYDDGPRAVAAFRRLLALDPSYTLPADSSPKIERYFERARRGETPLLPPPPRKRRAADPPFYKSLWFWGAIVVGAGVGIGAGLILADDEPLPPVGNLGTIELP